MRYTPKLVEDVCVEPEFCQYMIKKLAFLKTFKILKTEVASHKY